MAEYVILNQEFLQQRYVFIGKKCTIWYYTLKSKIDRANGCFYNFGKLFYENGK